MKAHGDGGVLVSLLGAYRLGLWKNIMRGRGNIYSHPRFEVGDGSKVHDLWCGDMALKDVFPYLVLLAQRMLLSRLTWNFLEVSFSGM